MVYPFRFIRKKVRYIGISSALGYLPPSATEDTAGFFGLITEIM